jgi:hypothetical protein
MCDPMPFGKDARIDALDVCIHAVVALRAQSVLAIIIGASLSDLMPFVWGGGAHGEQSAGCCCTASAPDAGNLLARRPAAA